MTLVSDVNAGTWAPAYDEEWLAATVTQTVRDAPKSFYAPVGPIEPGTFFQGDVVALASEIPAIDEEGQAVALEPCTLWLVLGNTCDTDRDLAHSPWVQLAPIAERTGLTPDELNAMRSYQLSRLFYLPPWPGLEMVEGESPKHVAQLTRAVAIHKTGLLAHGRVRARMNRGAWALLNVCMVRFVARADGRNT